MGCPNALAVHRRKGGHGLDVAAVALNSRSTGEAITGMATALRVKRPIHRTPKDLRTRERRREDEERREKRCAEPTDDVPYAHSGTVPFERSVPDGGLSTIEKPRDGHRTSRKALTP